MKSIQITNIRIHVHVFFPFQLINRCLLSNKNKHFDQMYVSLCRMPPQHIIICVHYYYEIRLRQTSGYPKQRYSHTHTHTRTQMRNGEIELIELNASNDCVCSFFRLFLCDIFRWPDFDTMPISTKLGFLGASVIRTFVKLIEPSIDNCNLIQSMSLYPISDDVVCLSWKYFDWINTNRTGFRLLSYQNRSPTTSSYSIGLIWLKLRKIVLRLNTFRLEKNKIHSIQATKKQLMSEFTNERKKK